MAMKILQIAIVCAAIILESKCAKNDDIGRPYEFGFTIDGEQHRYEKKDANGIIQGEFGFITADGIYHVTTYATDENGSFRILSMRNVRISDPLDGSGGTYSNKVPASSVQSSGNIPQRPQKPQQSQPQSLPHQQPQQQPPSHQQLQQPQTTTAVTGNTPPNNINQIIQTTTKRAPFSFTLQSTLKPACASCGYVAPTTKQPIAQFTQQTDKPYRPPQNQIFQIPLLSSEDKLPKATTASPFGFAGTTTTQTFNVNNNYKPGVYPLNGNQQRPPSSVPQTQILPISQSNQIPGSVRPTFPSQSPIGPPQSFQTQNQQSQIASFGPSQHSPPVKPSLSLPVSAPQFTSDTPSQFIEPPAFSPQQPQTQSNVNTLNPPFQPSPSFPGIQQPQFPPSVEIFKPGSESAPSLPTVQQPQSPANIDIFSPISELSHVENDTTQLPVNTFARPPINNQPEFDIKTPPGGLKEPNRVSDIKVENGMIHVPNNPPIPIKDKYPGMVDGLPEGIAEKDIVDLLYKFNYTIGFHGHYEKGLRNGTKIGGYFVNGRDGISRVITYVADENGYRPKFRLINLGLDSPDTPKEATEKKFGLKSFEFVWYPLK